MGKIIKASREHECSRCLGIINIGEYYEQILVKNPPEFKNYGGSNYTICQFHNYDCTPEKPDQYDIQEQDLINIAEKGISNNQI